MAFFILEVVGCCTASTVAPDAEFLFQLSLCLMSALSSASCIGKDAWTTYYAELMKYLQVVYIIWGILEEFLYYSSYMWCSMRTVFQNHDFVSWLNDARILKGFRQCFVFAILIYVSSPLGNVSRLLTFI